jgi:hypothetical protein
MDFGLSGNQLRGKGGVMDKTRKPRPDLTKEELKRLEKYGSIEFKSAGATRRR